jgi:hypothetical protein
MTISGVVSRRLQDRGLGRVIEDAWSAEIRSPSKMMAELAGALRGAGLNIFRHRKGMLFVSPIRIRTFGHDRTSVSVSINSILEKLTESPGLNRKQLAEKLVPEGGDVAAADRVKLSLGSDLRWLVSEGYVIEFNDGTLDLPRAKPPGGAPERPQAAKANVAAPTEAASPAPADDQSAMTAVAEQMPGAVADDAQPPQSDDAGGMSVEQSIAPVETPAAEAETMNAAPAESPAPETAAQEPAKAGETQAEEAPPKTLEEGAVPSPS